MKTMKQILVKARALIADPERWTKEAMARDAVGKRVSSDDSKAQSFCLLGALAKATQKQGYPLDAAADVMRESLSLMKPGEIPGLLRFNDDKKTEHADIMRLFDVTIARLDGKEDAT